MGATRVARRAGAAAEMTVTTIPTCSATTNVRGESTRLPGGSPKPMASISARIPKDVPMPNASPASDATTAVTSASPSTDAMTWRRAAPSARRSASSRVR